MSLRECPLCLTATIRPSIDDYYSLSGKAICLSCRDLLVSSSLSRPTLPISLSAIPLFPDFPLEFDLCPDHARLMPWVCELCEEPGCDVCIEAHPERYYESIQSCIEKRLKTMHFTEYLARAGEVRRPEDTDVRELRENVVKFYRQIRGMKAWEVYLHIGIAGNGFFEQLQGMEQEQLAQKTPEECLEDLGVKTHSDTEASDRWSRTLLWTHWSQHSLYLLDLETRVKEPLNLSSDFTIPLFSRTVLLPTGDLFLCGGRKEANGFSLNSCWKIDRADGMKVKRMPDLLYGRSNHWVLCYRNVIYVIAGCDQNNKFTNKCERFDLGVASWQQIAGTNETRDSISAVADPRFDCIYTAGGRVDNGVLSDSVERYDIGRNIWVSLHIKLPFQAYMQGVALLPGAGTRLLVFGGLNLAAQAIKKTCLVDLNKEEAVEIEGLKGDGGCVVDSIHVYAGFVYAFCFSGFAARTWERWSLDYQVWEGLPSFHS